MFDFNDLKNFTQSKKFSRLLVGCGAALVMLLIFQAGVFVGFRKAAFSYRWGDNYYRTFGSPHRGPMKGFIPDNLSNAHGTSGKVVKIDLPKVTILGEDGIEKMILLKPNTAIRKFRDAVGPKDILDEDTAVVIGSPNDDGYIEAKLMRLLPPKENFISATGTPIKK